MLLIVCSCWPIVRQRCRAVSTCSATPLVHSVANSQPEPPLGAQMIRDAGSHNQLAKAP